MRGEGEKSEETNSSGIFYISLITRTIPRWFHKP